MFGIAGPRVQRFFSKPEDGATSGASINNDILASLKKEWRKLRVSNGDRVGNEICKPLKGNSDLQIAVCLYERAGEREYADMGAVLTFKSLEEARGPLLTILKDFNKEVTGLVIANRIENDDWLRTLIRESGRSVYNPSLENPGMRVSYLYINPNG